MNTAIKLSLKTWYPEQHPLHNDPLHPAIGLAGEAGELLNLYQEEQFNKDGVSWWDCVCGHSKSSHGSIKVIDRQDCYHKGCSCINYIPKILDELGDLWYYLRILAYQQEEDLTGWILSEGRLVPDDMFMFLTYLNYNCALLLARYEDHGEISTRVLRTILEWFQDILFLLDCTLDQLTELNYDKLKDGDNNGWTTARKLL